ncbi:MAG: hydroxyacid dehydrogenase [Candidatus Accumulibacter sp. 66-26]|nr:2-hydroxyacid dehydrogenase [Accumulibacter sp.]OJW49757.1 MAG: hydroxyacid dehydrogenase [Candidatus Accumulibacter sp. 66-26]
MSDRHRVLLLGRQNPALEARLAAAYDLHRLADEADPHAFLATRGSEFAALVTSAIEGADGALLEALPALRVLSSFGVGLDRIDLAAARRRGIAVGYTPDVLNDCVADLAFGLLLDAARSISAADRYVRKGRWKEAPYPLAARVSGKRLGILGLGRIGRAVARRAGGFDMEVRYHNRSPAKDAPYAYAPSLTELARWSDFLVVAAAGGPASRHIVNGEVLAALGPQGFIVNVARGSVIDESALIEALREGRIAGAGLDVFAHEPNVPDALLALDNVVLLPHVGSGTNETRQAMADRVFDNLHAFFSSGRLISPAPFD